MSRGKIIAAVVALVLVVLVAFGIYASAQSRVPEVTAAEVEKEDLTQTVTASGQLEGDVKADVFPPASQAPLTIESIEVADGQQVKTGQILATLDTDPLEAAVAQARAAYRQAEAGLVQAQRSAPSAANRASANAAVAAAEQSVEAACEAEEAAEAQLVAARAQLTAARTAPITPPQTQEQHDAAVAAAAAGVEQAEAGVEQAEAGVAGARSQLSAARAQRDALKNQNAAIASARASVDAAGEALSQARENLDKATLTAPIDGVVVFAGGGSSAAAGGAAAAALGGGGGGKPVVGSSVSAASPPFTVFQLGALNFNAQVDEADISNVGVGMKGSVTLDAFPGVTFDTTVVQVKTQAIQTSTGGTAFPVLLSLKETGKRLLVGMGGNADIQVSGIEGAVTVPVEALFDEAGGTYVYVIGNDNVVRRREVKTGVMTDTRAQILSGVEPGQKVALGGLSNLKDGMTVRVK